MGIGPIPHLERLEALVPDVHHRPLRISDTLDAEDEAGEEDRNESPGVAVGRTSVLGEDHFSAEGRTITEGRPFRAERSCQ